MELKRGVFKKRGVTRPSQKSPLVGVFLKNKTYIELTFFKRFLVSLRKLYKKKKVNIFLNLHRNHVITRKPKNARMGKGKGKFNRFIY